LSHKPFSAGQWFVQDPQVVPDKTVSKPAPCLKAGVAKNKFPTFNNPKCLANKSLAPLQLEGFQPAQFLTPGWRGESLPSKASGRYVRLVETLQADVLRLLSSQDFNRSLKIGIYTEFLAYAKDRGLHCPELDDLGHFWQAARREVAEQPAELKRFLELFSSRVAVITLFKLRFIQVLAKQTGLEAGIRTAHNPNYWLSQVFRSGTRFELKARVMEANVFSWYRPGEEFAPLMSDWMNNLSDISIAELVKLTSPRVQDDTTGKVYSHALSQLNFGLFLNSLMINFPLWAESREPVPVSKFQTPDELEIISCKYSGDFMESLALSHWLAQHNNKEMKWDQVLCPDFKGKEFESGLFLKMLNELQFITFLAEVAPLQGQEPIDFISKIMGHHFQNRKGSQGQRSFAAMETPFSTSTYDRTVLNLCHLPKNNPYHWMMAQLDEQMSTLKPGGWLFMLANKSLFAPSQRERLEAVLQGLELKAVFDMEGVKGKGELGNWLYVFRRRQAAPSHDDRESVSWFRFTADMNSFHDFADITELLRGFYLSHLEDTPAMWQQEWGRDFRLEFFQDALMNGHLIHSTNEDQSRVTHPRYFKALMAGCVPLDTVFELRPMHPEEWQTPNSMGLGLRRDGATFLMVDLRDQGNTRLTLHPVSTFRAVYYENGSSHCQYFLIAPKHQGMDPNVLRKYFASQVGHQIINLTFNGSVTKVKGQLAKMLVPKWFVRGEFLPETLNSTLEMFRWNADKLIATHPDELEQRFKMFRQTANGLFPRYACDVLSGLVEFEQTLQTLTTQLADPRLGTQVNFENPALQGALAGLRATPLLSPTHPDLYVDFVQGIDSFDLEAPLTRVELRMQVEGDLKTWFLEVFNDKKPVVRLHSDEELLLFTQFIFQTALGRPLGRVLKALRLPALNEVREIVQQARGKQQVFATLLQESGAFLEESFRLHLIPEQG
jgi:hypothetical protein